MHGKRADKVRIKGGIKMKTNMAGWDRIIRIIIGIILIYQWITIGGLWWIAGVVGIVFILTSIIGYCPLYTLLGFKTKRD